MMENLKLATERLLHIYDDCNQKINYSEFRKFIGAIEYLSDAASIDLPTDLTWFGVTRPLSKNHLSGKIIILDFFTYCCMNCIHILPHLQALERKYDSTNKLSVIGIHSPKFENEKKDESVQKAIEKLGISHPVINDPENSLWKKFSVTCWPTLIVLGPKGKPLIHLVGEGHHKFLEMFIDVLMKYFENELTDTPLPLSNKNVPLAKGPLLFPGHVATSPSGDFAVVDTGHHRILVLSSNGLVKHAIGGGSSGYSDGTLESSQFQDPQGVVFHGNDDLFIADTGNHAIRHANLKNNSVTTIAGGSKSTLQSTKSEEVAFRSPWGLCMVPAPSYMLDDSAGGSVRPTQTPPIQNVGQPIPPPLPNSAPPPPPPPPSKPSVPVPPPMLYNSVRPTQTGPIQSVGQPIPPPLPYSAPPPPPPPPSKSSVPVPPPMMKTSNDLPRPAKSEAPDVLIIAMSGNHQIWAYFLEDTIWWKGRKYPKGSCVSIAGTGNEENRNNRFPEHSSFAQPSGLCYAASEEVIFVADSESSTIRKLCLKTGSVEPMVGGDLAPDNLFSYGDTDGVGRNAKLQHPLDVCWDSKNSKLIVVDTYNHKLKNVDISTKTCRTVNISRKFFEPGGLADYGDSIIISDTNNHELLCLDKSTLNISEIVVRIPKKPPKEPLREPKETIIAIPQGGSSFALVIEVPDHSSGKWTARDIPSSFTLEKESGIFDSEPIIVQFSVKRSDEVFIDIDISYCSDNACYLKRIRLKVRVEEAENNVSVNSRKFTLEL